jgi:hypothetical protein
VAYNFQIGNNKIKLLMEYENVTEKVLLLIESIQQIAKQLQHARLFVARKISLKVFSSILGVTVLIAATLSMWRVQTSPNKTF